MISPHSLPILVLSLLIAGASTHTLDHTGPAFTYSGSTGPEKWGSLSPQYLKCSSGKLQSPVDIKEDEVVLNKNLKPLTRDYRPAIATLVNNGFNIGIHYEENAGVLEVDGKNYSLKQMHWHAPSEHRINGVQYAAELHLVHKSDDGNFSVLAILFKYSDRPDPLLSKIEAKVHELAKEVFGGDQEAHVPLGTLDLRQLRKQTTSLENKKRSRKYYRYVGSLTTPPCSENVIWNIIGNVRWISKEQVEAIKAPLHSPYKNNSRPCQLLNGRKIELYDELHDNN